ncbi:MAG: ABC transporter ATP-binding protein [Candidatus Aminicenantes bacterium]|nr:ABC transporter ATP-binding protein [Candidatus Aminicenantes bacterium]
MDENIAVKLDKVSKKYCKSLKRSMFYGIIDISRNILGLSSRPGKLRKNEFWAVKNVSFELKKGEVLGVIGPNGSGKTTLLKMLNGIFWPDKGKISINGRVGALIEVGAGFHPMLTGRENIYVNGAILNMSKDEINRKFAEIVKFADIGDFIDMPVKHYSSGMFVRLGFAIAVHCEPDILLIDEILAVGDSGFQSKCFNKIGELKQKGTTTVLVSHNMHMISVFSDRAIVLKNGRAEYFNNTNEGVREYTKFFISTKESAVEKILNGNDAIVFFNVKINKREFLPGESFQAALQFRSSVDYEEVEIDVGIYTNNDPNLYFQATNKAYGKKVSLLKGEHELQVTIKNIPVNNAMAKVAISIWQKNRTAKLFWWRIPVEFKGIDYSMGKNFLDVEYVFK